jgi:hypothetical protein
VYIHEEEAAPRLKVSLDAINLDALPHVHDLDVRPLVGRDRVVHASLAADTLPVVGDSAVGIPPGIVG